MPKYYFHIAHGKYAGASESPFDFKDDGAAWKEMTMVCGDLVGGVCRDMKPNSAWHMELLDENKKHLFRIRLVSEPLN